MVKKFHKPVRMCISCRQRDEQKNLLRLICKDGNLEKFDGNGRSFYICQNCLTLEKQVSKSLMRYCKSGQKDKFMSKLKEIITDGRKS